MSSMTRDGLMGDGVECVRIHTFDAATVAVNQELDDHFHVSTETLHNVVHQFGSRAGETGDVQGRFRGTRAGDT